MITRRRARFVFRLFAIAVAVLGTATSTRADDRVELRDGRILAGEITGSSDDSVDVRTTDGTETIRTTEIKRIVRDAPPAGATERAATRPEIRPAERTGTKRAPSETAAVGRSSAKPADTPGVDATARAVDALTADEVSALREELLLAAERDPTAAAAADLLRRMESAEPSARVGAMDEVVAAWPDSRAALRIVLIVGNAQARTDGARILREPRLGDTADLCLHVLRNATPAAKMQALRAIYDKRMSSCEKVVREIVAARGPWPIRQEAARALERIGGAAAFPVVVEAWKFEQDAGHKRRLKRTMRAILGTDLGDDAAAWDEAVWSARHSGLQLRGAPRDQ